MWPQRKVNLGVNGAASRTLKSTVAKTREIRQYPQSQTDYQNSEAGNNGKSGISQMPKKFSSQLPKNNASKHPAWTVVTIK